MSLMNQAMISLNQGMISMDFFYFIFRSVFYQIRKTMERQEKKYRKMQVFPEGVVKHSYRYWSDEDDLRACNLYLPTDKKSGDLPLIIDIHGGCWVHGDKDSYDNFNYDLARKGNVVSSLTYRLIDQVHMKEMIQDIFSYLHFLESRKKDLGIQTDDVMLTGDSAGAQLSLLFMAMGLQELFEVTPVNIHFSAMALTHPVCWIDQAATLPNQDWLSNNIAKPGLLRMIFGKNYKKDPIAQASMNPECYIKEGMKLPPVMIVTSSGDDVFSYQAFKLKRFLERMGFQNTMFYEEDKHAEHVYNVNRPFAGLAEKCNSAMMEFFSRSSKTKKLSHRKL